MTVPVRWPDSDPDGYAAHDRQHFGADVSPVRALDSAAEAQELAARERAALESLRLAAAEAAAGSRADRRSWRAANGPDRLAAAEAAALEAAADAAWFCQRARAALGIVSAALAALEAGAPEDPPAPAGWQPPPLRKAAAEAAHAALRRSQREAAEAMAPKVAPLPAGALSGTPAARRLRRGSPATRVIPTPAEPRARESFGYAGSRREAGE